MKILAPVAGALIGAVVGYFAGVIAACDWLYPNSNLCGIYGVFVAAPVGLVLGAIVGWRLSRSGKSGRTS